MKSVAELDKKAERKAPSLLDQPRRCVPPGAGHFSARARRTFLPRSQSHREKRMQATVARAAAPVGVSSAPRAAAKSTVAPRAHCFATVASNAGVRVKPSGSARGVAATKLGASFAARAGLDAVVAKQGVLRVAGARRGVVRCEARASTGEAAGRCDASEERNIPPPRAHPFLSRGGTRSRTRRPDARSRPLAPTRPRERSRSGARCVRAGYRATRGEAPPPALPPPPPLISEERRVIPRADNPGVQDSIRSRRRVWSDALGFSVFRSLFLGLPPRSSL